jgi:cytochrome P450
LKEADLRRGCYQSLNIDASRRYREHPKLFHCWNGRTDPRGWIAMQQKAYQAIMDVYPNGDAIEHAFDEEKVPYIVALYKEILRNHVVLPFALPHMANEDVRLKSGMLIPKGTTLYINTKGGNHGESISSIWIGQC